jgi:nicotinamidase-related amidase
MRHIAFRNFVMSQLQTMLQLSGRGYAPAMLGNATLLIIDAQEEYRSGVLALPGLAPAMAEIAQLLSAARAQNRPIVFVRHLGAPGSFLDPQTRRGHFLPELAPLPNELVVEKRLPNAFAGTELNDTLIALGHLELIVCGFMTHSSVSTTVRAAKDYGYRCTLVDAACATRDIPLNEGGTLSADQLHRVEMAALADNFAMVVPNAQAVM